MARKRLSKAAAHRHALKVRVTDALSKEIALAAREQGKPRAVVVRTAMIEWACERVAARETIK
jgi:hypothetical protein